MPVHDSLARHGCQLDNKIPMSAPSTMPLRFKSAGPTPAQAASRIPRSTPFSCGPEWKLIAEFNDRPHEKGVVSMARSVHEDSAGSQFFICLDRAPHLDGKYTAFGKVTKGIEVVDAIAAVECANDRPVNGIPKMLKVTA